jgi:hypothetical protein
MTDLQWLAEWFQSQANGHWEHEYGITIATLDNPGWSVRVDLSRTPLRDLSFKPEQYESGSRWQRFWKDDKESVFHAAGDVTALPEMINRFRRWVTESS